jgi:hypothetical protein
MIVYQMICPMSAIWYSMGIAAVAHHAEGLVNPKVLHKKNGTDFGQSFSDVRVRVRVRQFRTLKTLRTRTQRVC